MRLTRIIASAVLALTVGAGVVSAAPTVVSYDFTGGPATNPGPFSGAPNVPYVSTQPTVSASGDATGVVDLRALGTGVVFTANGANVSQTPAGLGVQATSTGQGFFFGFPVGPPFGAAETILDGSLSVDNLGFSETLSLEYTATDGLIGDSQLLGATINSLSLNGGADDVEIYVDGNLVDSFNLAALGTNNLDLSGYNVFLNDGSTIDFQAVGGGSFFSVAGIDVGVTLNPEPASIAVWSVLLLTVAGATYYLRRNTMQTVAG